MDHFNIEHCSFIGPSYGGGIILRLASFMPEKIDCAVLVSPAGITLGSKMRMMKEVLLPLLLFNRTSSEKYLNKITGNMSENTMKEIDKRIIGDVFKYIRLEQDMPKLTKREELAHYTAPTMVIAGEKDLFFPENRVRNVAKEVIPNLVAFKAYDMGHFPSETHLVEINREIINFLKDSY
jgi:pimeloyl-ACP methyl ester carboxylesterase